MKPLLSLSPLLPRPQFDLSHTNTNRPSPSHAILGGLGDKNLDVFKSFSSIANCSANLPLTVTGPSRCFPFWQEVLACYVVNTSADDDTGKRKCAPALEDYYECLHHRKEVCLPCPLGLLLPILSTNFSNCSQPLWAPEEYR